MIGFWFSHRHFLKIKISLEHFPSCLTISLSTAKLAQTNPNPCFITKANCKTLPKWLWGVHWLTALKPSSKCCESNYRNFLDMQCSNCHYPDDTKYDNQIRRANKNIVNCNWSLLVFLLSNFKLQNVQFKTVEYIWIFEEVIYLRMNLW